MSLTKVRNHNIADRTITEIKLSETITISSLPPKINTVSYANSTFTVLDDTAVNTGGGYIVITGSNFAEGATVIVDQSSASAVTRVNSTTLNVQVPAKSAATYNLYVINPDGGTGIRVTGITYSGTPTWVTGSTLTTQNDSIPFYINLSATGATSYTVSNNSTLPAGTALLANGYFYGNVNIVTDTTYSFDVVATDAENQDASKTFGLTVLYIPQQGLFSFGGGTNSPVQIGTDINWAKVAVNDGGIGAVKTNGTLWTWGTNSSGRLGLNDRTDRVSPTQVGTGTNWSQVVAGAANMYFIQTNGVSWSTGTGTIGAIGEGLLISRSSPVQVGGSSFGEVTAGSQVAFGVLNGNLSTWGVNNSGVMGINTVARSTATFVGSPYKQPKVSNLNHVMYIGTTNGTLWGAGGNNYGQLGKDNRITYSSPVQVGALYGWDKLAVGPLHSMSIKTDGTLWSWGKNSDGQLGLGDTIHRSSPVQIGTDTNWSAIVGNNSTSSNGYSVALKTDGTMWTWGDNSSGQLGVGDFISRSSPVQVGLINNWTYIAAESNRTFAINQA